MLPPRRLPAQEGEVEDGCQFVAETPDAGYSCSGEPCHLASRAMSLDREQITPGEQDRPLQRNLSSHLGGCLHKRERSRMAASSWRRHPMKYDPSEPDSCDASCNGASVQNFSGC